MRAPIAVAALAALAIAGCGGGSSGEDDPAADRERFEDAQVRFAQCMREQGIDMPDPEGGRIVLRAGPGGNNPEKLQAAQEKCNPILEEAGGPPELSDSEREEFQDQALAFARCMREQGIDMPDPEFQSDGGVLQRVRPGAGGADPSSSRFREAEEKCREFRPEGPGGPGAK